MFSRRFQVQSRRRSLRVASTRCVIRGSATVHLKTGSHLSDGACRGPGCRFRFRLPVCCCLHTCIATDGGPRSVLTSARMPTKASWGARCDSETCGLRRFDSPFAPGYSVEVSPSNNRATASAPGSLWPASCAAEI